MEGLMVFALVAFFVILGIGLKTRKETKYNKIFETILIVVYFLSLIMIGLGTNSNQYYETIVPDESFYSPFSDKSFLTLVVYFILYNLSILLVWLKGKKLPPLTLVISLVFILIGLIINVAIILQVTEHNTESLNHYDGSGDKYFFLFAPSISFIIGVILIIKVINQKVDESVEKVYSNKLLNSLNHFLSYRNRQPLWVLLLLLPIFFLITIILTLFGQDINSIIKVFTDTTTWRFSQQMHPPPLDHTGHYLCTVAASGNPKIVKPLRFGKRGGSIIIVNRQLLIANAFEEMIQNFSPSLHKFIRSNYDKYGYNLSAKINTVTLSNLTYILMKPLEWIFLICLYLFCINPEEKIRRQYLI